MFVITLRSASRSGSSRNLLRRGGFLAACLAVFMPATSRSQTGYPAWWTNAADGTQIIDSTASHEVSKNYAPVNAGQLKNVAAKARQYFSLYLPGGVGTEVNTLVDGFNATTYSPGNYAAVNLGQLKAAAKPFYDRLMAAGYDTRQHLIDRGYPSNWSSDYPWLPATPVAENYAPANLGQLKAVFSFDVWGHLLIDRDEEFVPANGNAWFSMKGTTSTGVPMDLSGATWSVNGGGSISPYGNFTSNGTTGTFTVTATNGSQSVSTTVTVYTPVFTTFTITPDVPRMLPSESVSIWAAATDQHGNYMDIIGTDWTLSGGGSIDEYDSSATFTSNGTEGTFTITATHTGKIASTNVTVYTPALTTIQITPPSMEIPANDTVYLSAQPLDQQGQGMDLTVDWAVSGGGTLTPTFNHAAFLSNGSFGTFTVTASSGSVSGTATVTVSAPVLARLQVAPLPAALLASAPGAQFQFTALGFDQFHSLLASAPTGLSWSTSGGGTINSSSGLFTSNGTAGTYAVTVSKGSLTHTAQVRVFTTVTGIVTGLQAKGYHQRVKLYWPPYNLPGGLSVHHYNVYRSTSSSGPFVDIADVSGTPAPSYLDRGRTNDTTYWYRVTAVLSDGQGHTIETSPSAAASATPIALPLVGPMDIAFIVDNSGSMSGAIGNIQSELENIVDDIEIASGNDYRLALVTPDTETFHVRLLFSALNGEAFVDEVEELSGDGGGGAPESTDLCLKNILNTTGGFTTDFRPGAKKVIIMITDALPSGGNDIFVEDLYLTNTSSDEYLAHQYALQAESEAIQIGSVAVLGGASMENPDAFHRVMHDYYAALTAPAGHDPVYREVPSNGQGAAEAIMDVIQQTEP